MNVFFPSIQHLPHTLNCGVVLPAPSFHPQCNKICFSFICSFFKHVHDSCYKTGGTVPRQYWNLKQMKKYLLMFWGGACHRKLFPPGDGGESIPFSSSNSISSVRRSRWDWKRLRSTVWMKGHSVTRSLPFSLLFFLLRTSFLHGLCHSHPCGPTPRLLLLQLLLLFGLPHPHPLTPRCFPGLSHYLFLRSQPSAHHGWFSLQERGKRDQDLSCIAAAWMGSGAYLRDLPAPTREL